MGSRKGSSGPTALKKPNKLRRQELFVQKKRATNKSRHEERHRRKKEEDKDPELRRQRLEKNRPVSLDMKRVWDEDADEETLGAAVDFAQAKRRRLEEEEERQAEAEASEKAGAREGDGADEDVDSMLGSEDEDEDEEDDDDEQRMEKIRQQRLKRDSSLAPSTTSTNLDLTPASLAAKFPVLFSDEPPPTPKILVTTSLNATIHKEAQDIGALFPNSQYIPRSAHRYGHKYSVREICKFASNRGFTAVIVVTEDLKKPSRLSIVHLPSGPTLTYTITRYIPGKKLPGHGNPTEHYPELLLNNFKTSLGLLTAKSLWRLFPPRPEIAGRQVVTFHNQRDYIFVRHSRYIVRERKPTEKSVVGVDGKEIKGFEGIRVGLQELGPRFTMKLRRVDKGIGRAGSEGEDALQWEWKSKMEKTRTRFNL
ncbi:hypothetical protein VTK73DRAFT_8422 [Phialemonium thermophilum]|uniref:Brix domain-containing protein n=1 Tax=Phialemonium thermophilum TaxID=223376 RepID=A0ABR3W8U8_9PEZI